MVRPRFTLGLLALAVLAGPSGATDLAKVPRTIGKEPAYASREPRYCLLLFGPEGRTRVWLVLDGDAAYLDRNGNGDLTEDGEKIPLPPFDKTDRGPIEGMRQHGAGPIAAWPGGRVDLSLMQMRLRRDYKADTPEEQEVLKLLGDQPDGVLTGVIVTDLAEADKAKKDAPLAMPVNAQVAMGDRDGGLRFAARPQDAPIVHFHGPLTMTLLPLQRLVRGQETELKVHVGARGLGAGTFAAILYQNRVPEDVHPEAEVEFPPASPGMAPLKVRVPLKQRC